MTSAVDVHEHGSSDEKGIFVDARILTLGDAEQSENSLTQFLVELASRFLTKHCCLHGAR